MPSKYCEGDIAKCLLSETVNSYQRIIQGSSRLSPLELIDFRSFGYGCNVAIIGFKHSHRIYTYDGLKSLQQKYPQNSEHYCYLSQVLERMSRLNNSELTELSEDDISGQQALF